MGKKLICNETKKLEAVERLKLLGLSDEIIQSYQKGGSGPLMAGYFDADEVDIACRILKFQNTYNALVYLVIGQGDIESYLYISDHKDEWEYDHMDIHYNEIYAFVCGDNPNIYPEIGTIGVKVDKDVVRRVY